MKKSSEQLRKEKEEYKAAYSEGLKQLNRELRTALTREENERKAAQRKADRKEADEVLAYLRCQGVPIGQSVEFIKQLQPISYGEKGDSLLKHLVISVGGQVPTENESSYSEENESEQDA